MESRAMIDFIFPVLFFSLLSPSSARPAPYGLRISCGAGYDVHTPAHNTSWSMDFGYTGGTSTNGTRPSFITPQLETVRYFPLSDGPENCYYINKVPNGRYSVRIFFGLIDEPNFDNEPLFDVSVEGTQVYSLKPGWSYNDNDQAFVEALLFLNNGSASLCFHSTGHGDPTVLSIEILQLDSHAYNLGPRFGQGSILRTVKRVNCGADEVKFDADFKGDPWGGDRFWDTMGTAKQISDHNIYTEESIRLASASPNFYSETLYQTALLSTDTKPSIAFQFGVEPNRNYSVLLHFAEIDPSISGTGERVFDILLNDGIAFKHIDIVKLSGGLNTAVVLNKTIAVIGRSLTVRMNPRTEANVLISAIEIFEVITAEISTSAIEVRTLQILKNALGLPSRFGWNGDPCVPQQHPWSGVKCQYNRNSGSWVINGLGLDNQGLRGLLPVEISQLGHLQSINLSGNSMHGMLPPGLGNLSHLEKLDLSYNSFNGSIPETLGSLASLQKLYLNGNSLTGRVPPPLMGRLLYRASFNFTDNAGLCGVPGLPTCGTHLTTSVKIGIGFGVAVGLLFVVICLVCWWKRRQNMLRAQKIVVRDAPYAKARTHFSRDIQMTVHHNHIHGHNQPTENGHNLHR